MADEKTTPPAEKPPVTDKKEGSPAPSPAVEWKLSEQKPGARVLVTNLSPGGRGLRIMKNGMAKLYVVSPKKSVTVSLADPQNPQYALWEELGAVTFAKPAT